MSRAGGVLEQILSLCNPSAQIMPGPAKTAEYTTASE